MQRDDIPEALLSLGRSVIYWRLLTHRGFSKLQRNGLARWRRWGGCDHWMTSGVEVIHTIDWTGKPTPLACATERHAAD